MKIYKSIHDLIQGQPHQNWAFLIGNFDGVHIGHQFLIKKARKETISDGLKLCLISFSPHPVCVLNPHFKPFLINTMEERREILEKEEISHLVEMRFTRDLSIQEPGAFLEGHILKFPSVKSLYFGHDFSFGANKKGNFNFTRNYCLGRLSVKEFPVLKESGLEISSSLIRHKIRDGLIKEANKFLGRKFFLRGLVIKGLGRGKKIGFPTANLKFHKSLILPKRGVYASWTLLRGMKYMSITNIGVNPTFNSGEEDLHVETYIFDFDDDLYGEKIEVQFRYFIRSERKFSNINELIHQINRDCHTVRSGNK